MADIVINTTPIALNTIVSSAMFDQFFSQALFAYQQQDLQQKLGIAESAAARGQAWMDPGAIFDSILDASARGAIGTAWLDFLAKMIEQAVQLEIARENNQNALDVENLRISGELSVLQRRFDLYQTLYAQWLPFAQKAIDDYYTRLDRILNASTDSPDPDFINAFANLVSGQARALAAPILPPAPPAL